jgi:hypothetical protein
MAATRSYSAPVVALSGLSIGLTSAILVSAVVSGLTAQQPTSPGDPPPAIAQRPAAPNLPDAPPAPEPGDDDDEDLPDPMPPAADPPVPTTTDDPPPAADDGVTKPVLEARPVRPLAAPRWTPEQMQASLLRVPEVWLQPPAVKAVAKTGRATGGSHPALKIIDARDDLRGLPARRAPVAQLPRSEGDALRDASVLLRKELGLMVGQVSQNKRLTLRPEVMAARPQMVTRLLHQMLQIESVPLRTMLLTQLEKLRNPAATRALAHRAVYEPLADLREEAVQALGKRSPAEYLPVLLDALGSAWPPAADQAADALVALSPPNVVSELVRRLDAVDPSAPVPDSKGAPVVHELVRVNHHRNCLLCHAQSASRRDGVRVAVPNPLKPLPSAFSLDTYEGGGRGGSRTGDPNTTFVRPDVTYLQQDFSWVLPVSDPGPWPVLQRYDFLVRTRPAGPGDAAPSDPESPQKKAVVRALRTLTGQDFGDRAADWRAGLSLTMK